jgi:hypothetical protein
MATRSDTIPKNPSLDISQDYLQLRRKGIEYIEKSGSRWWTDYNSHDPGITILEALCYAITDLGYRTGWNISDLLTSQKPGPEDTKNQAFFTAREILTVSPLTLNDYRRILIDMDNVSNAWLFPLETSCETGFFADCEKGSLGYTHPESSDNYLPVSPLGAYTVLLELENDVELGDLNDRKIRHLFTMEANQERYAITLELRFPEWDLAKWGNAANYVDEEGRFSREIDTVVIKPSLLKSGEPDTFSASEKIQRWRQWQRVYYASVVISFKDSAPPAQIEMKDVPFRLFGSGEARSLFTEEVATRWNYREIGELFLKKMALVERTLKATGTRLDCHRNLCEDFCCPRLVCVQDVAVCADIDVTADADIELVLANVLFRIEHYFNPGIRFYTLQELMAEGMAVEDIFEGPQLAHGFVKTEDLERAGLKSQLRTSDIINEIVEIEGVVAVRNLLLTRYGKDGIAESGAADGASKVNKDKISAEWTLEISDRCQPRLYVDNSNFIFYKNGLPFTPRSGEVQDTLSQLRGQEERLKLRNLSDAENDLPVPEGTYRNPGDYSPVQYLFPLTYGIGTEGLREPATEMRRAQARQLKAYLMVFEQLLANAFSQLANVRNLFSLDKSELQSYFVRDLRDDALIRGVTGLLDPSLTENRLKALAESKPEIYERRNRFLDHLLARFGEQFTEYALLLTNYEGALVASGDLVGNKIAFLNDYPRISRERARGFDYKAAQPSGNQTVLRDRIALLLGLETDVKENIIVVEHLLLRPRFPGDALMEVCLEKSCPKCGEEDPYSFQFTVIMPGWIAPYDRNIELRRFADRTIHTEMPAHLLGKVCWVNNTTYGKELESELATLLQEEGRNAGNARPGQPGAEKGAENIQKVARLWFDDWKKKPGTKPIDRTAISGQLDMLFRKNIESFETIYKGVKNYDVIGDKIFRLLVSYYTLEFEGVLFERFKDAWYEWLDANAKLDWCAGQVPEKIEALLLITEDSAKSMAMEFGALFSDEMKKNVLNGVTITDLKDTVENIFKSLPPDILEIIKTNPAGISLAVIKTSFTDIYSIYTEATMALWRVLLLLSRLHSIYPQVTLHDCDDGNDANPLRLGSTSLGG